VAGFTDLFHTYGVFDSGKGDKPLTLDLVLDPGLEVRGTLRDPDGKPVRGAVSWGLEHDPVNVNNWSYRNDLSYRARLEERRLDGDTFTARGLPGNAPRTLSFVHEGRKLIGYVVVRGKEKGPLVVTLRPWGTLTGRLVGADGKPLAGVRVRLDRPALPESWKPAGIQCLTDAAGRFRVEGLLPGETHGLTFSGAATGERRRLTAAAGQTKDLGDIPVRPVREKK
jgi:hypothetical protein